jgi:radical SAM superfamily enzyme YgiQ (UPF0313 family)
MHIKLVGLNARYTHSCLALFYVRNELEKHCPEVHAEIVQGTINDSCYETLLRLSAGSPAAIFFSAAVWNSELVRRLIIDLRKALPDCLLVVGGPQAGVIADQLPPGYCTAVLGEIEAITPDFYRDLQQGSLRPCYNGAFFRMAQRCLEYPFRETDFDRHLRNRHIYYESSRGCPFSCTYCLSASERSIYHKDLEQVFAELEQILSRRPQVLRFVDRTFNDNPARALAIWRYLAEWGHGTLFHFEIAPDRFTEEMFAFLAGVPSGIFQFEIGIQSTHEETLAAIRRRIDPRIAHGTIARLVSSANIHLHVDLILGLPCETRETFLRSFAEVFAMGPQYIQMGLLKLLPDTAIRETADDCGYLYCADPPYSVLANRWLDHATMSDLYWFCECVEKFHNNRYFVSLWRYLRRREEDIAVFFQELLNVCRRHDFFELAATQEFLCRLLCRQIAGRKDERLLIELLRHDWLRCGHRFLPEFLDMRADEEPSQTTKDHLYGTLPEELAGVYRRGEKNHFFKKAFCLRFSLSACRELGFRGESGSGAVCFLAEREDGLFRFNRVLAF